MNLFKLDKIQYERINTLTPSSQSSSPNSIILTNDNSGSIIFCDPVNYGTTFYLPSVSDGLNFKFIFKSVGINNITINSIDISSPSTTYTSQTASLIYGNKYYILTSNLTINTTKLYIGDCFEFISDGNYWYITHHSNKSFENSIEFYDDFTTIAPSSGTATNIIANPFFVNWAFTGSDDDFVLTNKDIEGGVWELQTDADDNDQLNLFGNKIFKLEDDKDLYFKARFRITSTADNDHGFFIGLTSNTSVDFIDDNCAAYNDAQTQSTIGFIRPADGGELLYKACLQNETTENSSKTAAGEGLTLSKVGTGTETANAVINNWINCEILVTKISESNNSHFKITYNLNDETTTHSFSVAPTTGSVDTSYTNQVAMAPAISIKNGGTNAVKYEIDYIYVCQKR